MSRSTMDNGAFREAPGHPFRSSSPRICMPTWRNFTKRAFRSALYEAQDVLVETDNVDLIHLDRAWGAWLDEYWLRTPLYYDVSRKFIYANPGLKKVRLTREYDVFIAVCNSLWDIPYLNAIEGRRDHCRVSVCWIDELWINEIANYKYWLHVLEDFDYVFVGVRGSVSALAKAIGRRCNWIPGGVDVFRFSPFFKSFDRVIDVYSMGRRWEGVHSELLRVANQGELFYLHDTVVNTANSEVYDVNQHRDLFANTVKRSKYFMVAPAKIGAPETGGQIEVGYRYYEGAAAGAVMTGVAADCEAYRELFDWQDVVIEVHPDGSDIISILRELSSNPERTAAIGRRNAREALTRHDWVYRWKEMLRIVGIAPSERMTERELRLKTLATINADVVGCFPDP